MNFFSTVTIIVLFVFSSSVVFAQIEDGTCSSDGYTVITVNGIFTNEDNAISNRDNLERYLPSIYRGENVNVQYLFNPSHLGGI